MPETFVYAIYIRTTYIRTTPEKLWEALTSGDFSEKYWMCFRIEAEQKVGGRLRIVPPQGKHPAMQSGGCFQTY